MLPPTTQLKLLPPHSSHQTPDSTLDGIGSFSHNPFSFPSQTPSFGMADGNAVDIGDEVEKIGQGRILMQKGRR